MKTIPDSILNLTLEEIGFGEYHFIVSGTSHPLVEGVEVTKGAWEKILRKLRENPEQVKKIFEESSAKDRATTVREVIEGWEKHYSHYSNYTKNHRPSALVGLFRDSMALFFKKLLELGLTEEHLDEIVGAKEEIRLQEAADQLRERAIHESSRRLPVGL